MPSAEPLRVFISHKHHDSVEVREIAKQLKKYARQRPVRFFVSQYDIRAGQDWRRRIRRELRESNMLLLLYTNPSMRWDWCLYEAGLFTRIDADVVKPVVCIYAGDSPPGPLQNIQGVAAANGRQVREFLEGFYKSTEHFVDGYVDGDAADLREAKDEQVALNPKIQNKTLSKLAERIGQRFGRGRSIYPCHRIVLEVPEAIDLKPHSVPGQLPRLPVGKATPRTLLDIFGRGQEANNWQDLVQSVGHGTPQRWARELSERLAAVLGGNMGHNIFTPITTTFRGNDGRIYCPELYRVDYVQNAARQDRITQITVVFDALDAPSVVGDAVFNLIRANFRFRDEVFAVYAGQLQDRITREQDRGRSDGESREFVFDRLKEALGLIQHEAIVHGFFDPSKLAEAYGTQSPRRHKVNQLHQEWQREEQALRQNVDRGDVAAVESHLVRLHTLNRDLSRIAAERHCELMGGRLSPTPERPRGPSKPSDKPAPTPRL